MLLCMTSQPATPCTVWTHRPAVTRPWHWPEIFKGEETYVLSADSSERCQVPLRAAMMIHSKPEKKKNTFCDANKWSKSSECCYSPKRTERSFKAAAAAQGWQEGPRPQRQVFWVCVCVCMCRQGRFVRGWRGLVCRQRAKEEPGICQHRELCFSSLHIHPDTGGRGCPTPG